MLLVATTVNEDPQLSTPQGGPRQFSLVDSSTIAGGGLPSVANVAALSALSTASLSPGALAYVQSVGAYWSLHPADTTTPADGITVANASGGGRWFRALTGIAQSAQLQAAWFVSQVSGNDEND